MNSSIICVLFVCSMVLYTNGLGRAPTTADTNLCLHKLYKDVLDAKQKYAGATAAAYYNAMGQPCRTYCKLLPGIGEQIKGDYDSPDFLDCGYGKCCFKGQCEDTLATGPKGTNNTNTGSTTPTTKTT